jgi:predicted acetyltransferase
VAFDGDLGRSLTTTGGTIMSFMEETQAAIAPARLVRGDETWAQVMNDVAEWAFGGRPHDPRMPPTWGVDFSRVYGVEVDEPGGPVLAAVSSAWSFDIPVPGGRVPAGGLTWVSVRPGYRRRGFLRAMIAAHFQDCAERGEPMSMLCAAELPLYGRFGYGVASQSVSVRIPSGAALRPIPAADAVHVHFDTATFADHDALVQDVRKQAGRSRAARPGWTELVTIGAREQRLTNTDTHLRETERLRVAVARRDGRPTGFALFRRDGKVQANMTESVTAVEEFVATDPASAHALWQSLIGMDLTAAVTVDNEPLDGWLFSLLLNWRAAKPLVCDAIHTRLIDLPAALAARRYAAPVDLVLEVTDPLLPTNTGTWRLHGNRDHAEVTAAPGARPDIVGDIAAFSAAYLGGTGLAVLEDAGQIRETTPDALELLDTALHSYRAPALATDF